MDLEKRLHSNLMKDYKILVLLNKISRSSGGMSSALDLLETLYQIGFNVRIGLSSSSVYYKLIGFRNCKTLIPFKRICTIPVIYDRLGSKRNVEPTLNYPLNKLFKVIIRFLLYLIEDRNRHFLKILSEVDIIIDAANLTEQSITILRKHSSAKIVLNHAGSRKAYEDYWLTDERFIKSYSSGQERYYAFCRLYDALLFQGQDLADECIENDISLKTRCFVLPPTCQEAQVIAAKQADNPYRLGRRAIVCIGSIQPRKAQHLAIKAFFPIANEYRDVDLHFVGEGLKTDYGVSLLKIVEEARLSSRVFFHGFRPDYLRFIAYADFLLQTSEAEGISRVLREAMLISCPIVGFSIPGTSSLLESGRYSVLAEFENIDDLTEKMLFCLGNPVYLKKIAEAAQIKYFKTNSWAAYATNLNSVINEIMTIEAKLPTPE